MTRFAYVLVLGLSLVPVSGWSVFADDAAPSGQAAQGTDQGGEKMHKERGEWCKNNPEKCKERREHRREWCKNNPDACKKKHEEWCEKHPDRCHKGDGDSKGEPDAPGKSPTE
jgi:hypothetical protein